MVKGKVKPLCQESVFLFLSLENTFFSVQKTSKKTYRVFTGTNYPSLSQISLLEISPKNTFMWLLQISLSLKSLYWNKIIIISFFSLLSTTISIKAY